MADERHGFVAAKTSGRRCGRRDLRQRSFPIEQGQDALPFGFGGRTEPAEVADALKSFGQDVVEETAQELRDAELQDTPLLIGTVFVLEGDLVVIGTKDALRTQGSVVNVSSQILDSSLSAASGLNIDHPSLTPDRTGNGVGVRHWLHCSLQTVAETSSQKFLWQEELRRRRSAPTQGIGAQTARRDHAMNVRMKL